MSSLREILFQRFASEGRKRAVEEFQKAYDPKKGDRFNSKGITYELGQISVDQGGIEYEISSKIPMEDLQGAEDLSDYFEAVKVKTSKKGKVIVHAGVDDVVQKVGEQEVKKRDYVRLRYKYGFEEMYDDAAIQKEAEAIISGKTKKKLPEIPGVITIPGRLVLLAVADSVYAKAKEDMHSFMEAN